MHDATTQGPATTTNYHQRTEPWRFPSDSSHVSLSATNPARTHSLPEIFLSAPSPGLPSPQGFQLRTRTRRPPARASRTSSLSANRREVRCARDVQTSRTEGAGPQWAGRREREEHVWAGLWAGPRAGPGPRGEEAKNCRRESSEGCALG